MGKDTKKYTCDDCTNEFEKSELDSSMLDSGSIYCKDCARQLAEAGWDSVDPNREFDTFTDWSNSGN